MVFLAVLVPHYLGRLAALFVAVFLAVALDAIYLQHDEVEGVPHGIVALLALTALGHVWEVVPW